MTHSNAIIFDSEKRVDADTEALSNFGVVEVASLLTSISQSTTTMSSPSSTVSEEIQSDTSSTRRPFLGWLYEIHFV